MSQQKIHREPMRKNPKAAWRKAQVVRVTYEPDYGDEAWAMGGEVPTPATHPDAFYAHREPAYPRPKAGGDRPRKTPHMRLSKTALRKRLYQAGVRGAQINKLALEILAGPPTTDLLSSTGSVALGWNVDAFKEQFGKRIARAVLRSVSQILIILDEWSEFLNTPMMTASTETMFRNGRKFNAAPVAIEQNLSDFLSTKQAGSRRHPRV
jgi:hypothetical protein